MKPLWVVTSDLLPKTVMLFRGESAGAAVKAFLGPLSVECFAKFSRDHSLVARELTVELLNELLPGNEYVLVSEVEL